MCSKQSLIGREEEALETADELFVVTVSFPFPREERNFLSLSELYLYVAVTFYPHSPTMQKRMFFITILAVFALISERVAKMANTERTFIMVKPDAVQRGLVGKIIERFEQKGFKLVAMKFMWVSVSLFYGVHCANSQFLAVQKPAQNEF